MEPSAHRKASSEQEDGFGVQPSRVADLGMVPNPRQSNSRLYKNGRPQCHLSSSEKVGFPLGSPACTHGPGGPPVTLGWACFLSGWRGTVSQGAAAQEHPGSRSRGVSRCWASSPAGTPLSLLLVVLVVSPGPALLGVAWDSSPFSTPLHGNFLSLLLWWPASLSAGLKAQWDVVVALPGSEEGSVVSRGKNQSKGPWGLTLHIFHHTTVPEEGDMNVSAVTCTFRLGLRRK